MGGGKGRGRGRGRGRGSSGGRSSSAKGALFVDGGILSDWSFTPSASRGKNPGSSSSNSKSFGSKSASFDRAKPASDSKNVPKRSMWNTFGYNYPSKDLQGSNSRSESNGEDNCFEESETIALVNTNEAQIFAYVDKTPSSKTEDAAGYTYDYSSDFVLGESSHKGLGFGDEVEDGTSSGVEALSKQVEEEVDPFFKLFSSEPELSAKKRTPKTPSSKKNSGFLSFGGMKLYTEDVSDEEDDEDEDDDRASMEEGSSDSSELGSSESDTSESGSDVDEDVANDYLEGIGGDASMIDLKFLVNQKLDESDDDTSSSSGGGYSKTVKKLSGIALQEASREYGMSNSHSKKKSYNPARDSWSPAMDDFMLIKDSRKISGKKKPVSRFPQSWPLGSQKSKNSRHFPGEKKKHRKEMIAVKRQQRMQRHGVDLEQISLKMEQIVLNEVDMYSFQPMHARVCSQVRRIAAIYRLGSGCQGSGKKGFVTVTRTQHTCMPSPSARVRLEQLIGAGLEDADFSLVESSNSKTLSGDSGRRSKKFPNPERKTSTSRHGRSNDRLQTEKRNSFASQPVSFISSGVMETNNVKIPNTESMEMDSSPKNKGIAESANFGAFEVHTKGFGSKMMAKMGYVEGGGLGKDGKGIAQPIEVVKRPKSLGLGLEFINTIDEPAMSDTPRNSRVKIKSGSFEKHSKIAEHAMSDPPRNRRAKKHIGSYGKDTPIDEHTMSDPPKGRAANNSLVSFEKHTKGFGSKMMAKMGFVEGTGLGRDSQGIVNPLTAVRRPKSMGLGAKR